MQVAELASAAHGFVAADLAALVSEATLCALRRAVASSNVGGSSLPRRGRLTDFKLAETRTRPSAMRELAFETPKVGENAIADGIILSGQAITLTMDGMG